MTGDHICHTSILPEMLLMGVLAKSGAPQNSKMEFNVYREMVDPETGEVFAAYFSSWISK